MQDEDRNNLDDTEFSRWIAKVSGVVDTTTLTDENLVHLFSDAMREINPTMKARYLLDVANMCLAIADITLGAQGYVATCLVLNKN